MENIYDRIFKENIEPLQLSLIAKLLDLRPENLVPIDAKMQVTQEREMDSIRKVVHHNKSLDYGLQIEFHVSDEDLRQRNLLHYGMFHKITGLPLRQIVIYLGAALPKKITKNKLGLTGLTFEFEVIILKDIPIATFIDSEIPEEVILAILCDFGSNEPKAVIRKILKKLKQILNTSDKIRKYQKQLIVLSRLRKIEMITKTEIEAMTIHYDIETDGLYLEGLEKGIEKKQNDFTLNLWSMQEFSIKKMAILVGVPQQDIVKTISNHLRETQGKTNAQVKLMLEPFLSK